MIAAKLTARAGGNNEGVISASASTHRTVVGTIFGN